MPIDASRIEGSAALQESGRPSRVRFEAFGRPFELDLQSNEQILRALPAATRARLPAHALYRGSLNGLPGSWVRLTRIDGRLYGAIWDGTEIYAVAPAGAIAATLEHPRPVDPMATMIYRAADVESGLGAGFCAAIAPGMRRTAAAEYQAVVAELNSPAAEAALVATGELDIGLIADTQFGQRFADPQGVMLSRLNTVDGIFSSQVGVGVVATDLRVLTSNGGLTSTAASTLLNQLADYRAATPGQLSRGLSHLMTGRDLDGSTVGVAFVGTICGGPEAASLSQQGSDPWIGALVTAHEIGHNFGALHDGETGSPCASTPQTFLMAAMLNGSSTFSQCSLDTMAPTVQSARCFAAVGVQDIELEASPGTVSGYARQPVDVSFDAVSVGNLAVSAVVVNVTGSAGLQVLEATVAGSSCTVASGSASCTLGDVAAGATRHIDARVRGSAVGNYRVTATVAAAADQNSANNTAEIPLALAASADGALTFERAAPAATEGQTTRVTVVLSTAGIEPLTGVSIGVAVPANSFSVEATAAEGGSCTRSSGQVSCTLGDVPANSTRRVDLDLRATRAGAPALQATLTASNDDNPANNAATATIAVAAAPGSSGGGGGGGGGRVDLWLVLTLLLPAAAARRARNRVPPCR
ncbi:MAG: M12 family metallo-peptidase [Steroidobacteraceae bacterium]